MRYTAYLHAPSLLGSATLAASVLLSASSAQASSAYPPAIAAKYSVTAPQCTLCHNNPAGGSGTATQPFAATMKSKYGLTGGSAVAVLQTGLDTNVDDTDGDGVSDVDEIKAGGDPNVSGGTPVEPPSYGCIEQSGSIAGPRSQSPRLASMAVAGLLAGFLFFRRRRLGSLL